MYEFHGWINIVADDSDEPESSVVAVRQNDLVDAVESRIRPFRNSASTFVHVARDLNGQAHMVMSGFRNHRDDRVLELFRWVAEHQTRSYGLLHVRDDEDPNGHDNAFVVHVIKSGSFSSATDENLSPCIRELEAPLQGKP